MKCEKKSRRKVELPKVGEKYGRLTITGVVDPDKPGSKARVRARCECGGEKEVLLESLRRGATKSCGCLNRERMAEVGRRNRTVGPPKVGAVYGRLTITNIPDTTGTPSEQRVEVRCECGEMRDVLFWRLYAEYTQSCGCLRKERTRQANTTHGSSTTRLYHVWRGMLYRCEHDPAYTERKIKVCSEWWEFEPFQQWSLTNGYTKGHSIDRIDNTKGYSPENCRWATREQQANNTSETVFLTIDGVKKSLSEWMNDPRWGGASAQTIGRRVKNKWPHKRALEKPLPARKAAFLRGSSTELQLLTQRHREMKRRCSDKDNPRYGGRGIEVEPVWHKFEPFRDWSLANGFEVSKQIDRINNDGNYGPTNCRWATPAEQALNKSSNLMVTAFGKTQPLRAWMGDPRVVVSYRLAQQRIHNYWDHEDALTRPRGERRPKAAAPT